MIAWRWPRSLRGRLLLLLFIAVPGVIAAQAAIAYREALLEADDMMDYQLQQTAVSLRSGLPLDEWLHHERSASAVAAGEDDLIVQVWNSSGVLLFRSVEQPVVPRQNVSGFADIRIGDVPYRVFGLRSPTHVIEVAQEARSRREMARELAWRTTAPAAMVTPLLLVLVWGAVHLSLAPVARVRQQIAKRRADDLTPLHAAALPSELQPMVDEMNQLFERLRAAFDAQRNFVADAAHELRSPLAALKLQAQGLRRARDTAAKDRMADRLEAGIERAAHLVDQLLVLARQQDGAADALTRRPLLLAELARLELADATQAADARGIDLGMERADDAQLSGHADALRVLLRNLLDNAIRYTPPGGTVDVAIETHGREVVLWIEDSGPGIEEAERTRVLDRFYRVPGTQASGSGLGLSIVKAVADLHGATFALARSERLGGLRVELRFAGLQLR